MPYRDLDDVEKADLNEKLAKAAVLLRRGLPFGLPALQAKYDYLLSDSSRFDDEVELLGYAFGSEIASVEWLNWAIQLDDEYGDTVAVAVDGLQVGCAPITMIRNRLEDGSAWSLEELRDNTVHRLRQLGQQATKRT